jgi:hypothetical protein
MQVQKPGGPQRLEAGSNCQTTSSAFVSYNALEACSSASSPRKSNPSLPGGSSASSADRDARSVWQNAHQPRVARMMNTTGAMPMYTAVLSETPRKVALPSTSEHVRAR